MYVIIENVTFIKNDILLSQQQIQKIIYERNMKLD